MGETPTTKRDPHEPGGPAIERLFEGAADPAVPAPVPTPVETTQEDSDA